MSTPKKTITAFLEIRDALDRLTEQKKEIEHDLITTMRRNSVKTYTTDDWLISLRQTPDYEHGFSQRDRARLAALKKDVSTHRSDARERVKKRGIDLPVSESLVVKPA